MPSDSELNYVRSRKFHAVYGNIMPADALVPSVAKKSTVTILTLNMLNCFEDYRRYIRILNYTLDLVWPK